MKPILVLLHGANGCAAEMGPLARPLARHFDIRAADLLGHGGRPVPDGISIEAMAHDLVGWLGGEGIGSAYVLGYSVGAYLGLYLARHHPGRVRGVITLSPKHVFDERTVAHITHLADPARLSRPGNPRKAELEAAHGADKWVDVTNNVTALFRALGEKAPLSEEDLRAIATPALLAFGDLDPLVPLAEAKQLGALLPNARLALFPGPAHPLRNVPIPSLAHSVIRFAREVESRAFAPGPTALIGEMLVSGGMAQGPSLKMSETVSRLGPRHSP